MLYKLIEDSITIISTNSFDKIIYQFLLTIQKYKKFIALNSVNLHKPNYSVYVNILFILFSILPFISNSTANYQKKLFLSRRSRCFWSTLDCMFANYFLTFVGQSSWIDDWVMCRRERLSTTCKSEKIIGWRT